MQLNWRTATRSNITLASIFIHWSMSMLCMCLRCVLTISHSHVCLLIFVCHFGRAWLLPPMIYKLAKNCFQSATESTKHYIRIIYTKHMTDILSSHKNVVINDSNLVLWSTLHSWQIGFQCFSNVWKILLSNGQTFAYKHAFFITSSSIHDSPFIRFALFCLSWLKSHHHLCLPAEQLLNEKNRVSEY